MADEWLGDDWPLRTNRHADFWRDIEKRREEHATDKMVELLSQEEFHYWDRRGTFMMYALLGVFGVGAAIWQAASDPQRFWSGPWGALGLAGSVVLLLCCIALRVNATLEMNRIKRKIEFVRRFGRP